MPVRPSSSTRPASADFLADALANDNAVRLKDRRSGPVRLAASPAKRPAARNRHGAFCAAPVDAFGAGSDVLLLQRPDGGEPGPTLGRRRAAEGALRAPFFATAWAGLANEYSAETSPCRRRNHTTRRVANIFTPRSSRSLFQTIRVRKRVGQSSPPFLPPPRVNMDLVCQVTACGDAPGLLDAWRRPRS